jgi:RNA polymerase sigma-70 factor (ECF subfamily)
LKISAGENEAQLIRLCKRGNVKAQFILVKRYSKAMYNIAVRMTSDTSLAEDILQDAFLKALSDLHKLNDEKAFGGWLKRIVINRCIDVMRKERHVFQNMETITGQHLEIGDEVDDSVDPGIVHYFIKKLPAGARQILVLHALEGYKYTDISQLLGISESTAKTQFFRAKQLLAKMIKTSDYEIEDREIPAEKPVEA